MNIPSERLLKKEEVQSRLSVSRATIERLIRAGTFTPVYVRDAMRIPSSQVDAYIEGLMKGAGII